MTRSPIHAHPQLQTYWRSWSGSWLAGEWVESTLWPNFVICKSVSFGHSGDLWWIGRGFAFFKQRTAESKTDRFVELQETVDWVPLALSQTNKLRDHQRSGGSGI